MKTSKTTASTKTVYNMHLEIAEFLFMSGYLSKGSVELKKYCPVSDPEEIFPFLLQQQIAGAVFIFRDVN